MGYHRVCLTTLKHRNCWLYPTFPQEFETTLEEELARLKAELISWDYKPKAVRRVGIPKPGGKGVRLLGIPCIRDRSLQASLKLILEPLFDPEFSESSYGFRPGRHQRQAVEVAH